MCTGWRTERRIDWLRCHGNLRWLEMKVVLLLNFVTSTLKMDRPRENCFVNLFNESNDAYFDFGIDTLFATGQDDSSMNSTSPHSLVLGNSSFYDAVAVESDRPRSMPNSLDIPEQNQTSEMDKSASMRCHQHSKKPVTPPSFDKEMRKEKLTNSSVQIETKTLPTKPAKMQIIHYILEDL